MSMKMILAVAAGGAMGSVARYATMVTIGGVAGTFPVGTMVVNVAGSFMIGLLVEALALKWQVSEAVQALLVVGVLGGFTTFSSFALDFAALTRRREMMLGGLYLGGSVFLACLAVFAGMYVVRFVLPCRL